MQCGRVEVVNQCAGAAPLVGDPRQWVREQVASRTRPLRHGGNLRYAWALDKRIRHRMPDSMPYPKFQGLPSAGTATTP